MRNDPATANDGDPRTVLLRALRRKLDDLAEHVSTDETRAAVELVDLVAETDHAREEWLAEIGAVLVRAGETFETAAKMVRRRGRRADRRLQFVAALRQQRERSSTIRELCEEFCQCGRQHDDCCYSAMANGLHHVRALLAKHIR